MGVCEKRTVRNNMDSKTTLQSPAGQTAVGQQPPTRYASASAPTVLPGKLLSFGVLTVCCVLITVRRLRELRAETGGTLCTFLTLGAASLLVICGILPRRRVAPVLRSGLASVTFGAAAAAFLLLTATAVSLFLPPDPTENLFIAALVKVFAALTAVYFLIASSSTSLPRKRSLHLLLAMAPIFFCGMRILNTFIINRTLPLANGGGYRILGMIFMMLFFVQEGKLLVGCRNASAYLVTGYLSALFCAAYDLPLLLYQIQGGSGGTQAVYSLLSVGLNAYILIRAATVPATTPPKSDDSLE